MVPFCKRWKELRKLIELTIFVSNLNLLFHSCFFAKYQDLLLLEEKKKNTETNLGVNIRLQGPYILPFHSQRGQYLLLFMPYSAAALLNSSREIHHTLDPQPFQLSVETP